MNYRNGTFVEVGAFDGVMQSNTKLLEEMYDWTGILIEPSENLFKTLCENRPKSLCYQCALGSFEQDNTYVWGDFNGVTMSSVNGSRLNRPADKQVLMRSLQSILDETGISHVNFFSLDTEGYELAILQGIDFKKTTFDYLLIEIYPDEYSGVVALLSANGYEMIENFSNYNVTDNPYWDGTHNDYLFKRVN
jgi:FkbM family methyltransferase